MSPKSGIVLLDQIAPRRRATIPHVVRPTGPKDAQKLLQDALTMDAQTLHALAYLLHQVGKQTVSSIALCRVDPTHATFLEQSRVSAAVKGDEARAKIARLFRRLQAVLLAGGGRPAGEAATIVGASRRNVQSGAPPEKGSGLIQA